MTCWIRLSTIQEVKDFVALCSDCNFDIHLLTDRYTVNAKSIMGIFSLDLGKPIEVNVTESGPEVQAFFEALSAYRST